MAPKKPSISLTLIGSALQLQAELSVPMSATKELLTIRPGEFLSVRGYKLLVIERGYWVENEAIVLVVDLHKDSIPLDPLELSVDVGKLG